MVVFRGEFKTREDETLLPNVRHDNGGVRLRTWLIGILGFLVVSLLFMSSFDTGQFRISHFINATTIRSNTGKDPVRSLNPKISGYLVNNEGCRIAALDPFDAVSRRYMQIEKPIECENGDRLPLIESNDTAVYVNPSAFYQYYNESETPNCCWTSFTRKAGQDNAVTYGDTCYDFEDSSRVDAEFVRVDCFRDLNRIYRDYHAFVPFKKKTEERCRSVLEKSSEESPLSLLVIGLDSVSRLNFHRMMPKTVESLMDLEAIELFGYNKVGDNTYPNLVPVLTGLSVEELEADCLENKKIPFDPCPFIWKNYSEFGYRTIFGEDACSMATFNYLKPGFRDPPTDYYLRPYCVTAESEIGNNRKLNANLCLGVRKNFENLLDYGFKVATKFANERYFAFFWQASLTHDFFNYPQLGDAAYNQFFRRLKKDDLLRNTALLVMSDHGMRWGTYRQTYQGRMEGSLPFVFVVLPPAWRERYPVQVANLRRNAFSLTTPYDLHETLVDLLSMGKTKDLDKTDQERRESHYRKDTRGISLFSPIPNQRTCSSAGIPEHWCMCHASSGVSLNDTRVLIATKFLVTELNRLLADYRQCSELRVERLIDAKMWIERDEQETELSREKRALPWIDFTITIETVPGNGIFEASIRQNATSNKLVGSVGRLNAYGTQSACVDDSNMRLYCYCY